jgi:hypothetical protein
MPTFTVHQPRPRKGEVVADPERFVFVRDGFYFWAFLLGPLWLLWRRLWLVFVLYLIVNAAIDAGLMLTGAPEIVKIAVGVAIALLVGFEAGTLWRWTLNRRGAANLGFVVGEDREMAERRFYVEWAKRSGTPPPATPGPQTPPVRPASPSGPDVIGLFPEPGARA